MRARLSKARRTIQSPETTFSKYGLFFKVMAAFSDSLVLSKSWRLFKGIGGSIKVMVDSLERDGHFFREVWQLFQSHGKGVVAFRESYEVMNKCQRFHSNYCSSCGANTTTFVCFLADGPQPMCLGRPPSLTATSKT